ncbi:MAG: arginine--tRNA ligase [Patescibacteria group bacterium]|nr:arginine--tRNA ligase [Patescibacteria group bacterium]MCL5095265.1 arginine--tRNA ligase [Patescibacteria group bacterium]
MIRDQIIADLKETLEKIGVMGFEPTLEHPVQMEHGDYSTNIAMVAFGVKTGLLDKRETAIHSPFDLAQLIVNEYKKIKRDYLEEIEPVKPGFINLWLKTDYLSTELAEVLKAKESYGSAKIGQGKTVIIDYSSPNIAKPFGIGHLRSTVIGQALYNLYRFLGWKTIGDNHLGDWGTQFGKLIVAIKKWHQGETQGLQIEDLEKLYVRFHEEAEKDPTLEEEARTWFKKLEDKDKEAQKIWQDCIALSLREFNRLYQLLDVKIDFAYGESFYQDKMEAVINEAKKQKLAVLSDGALIIDLTNLKMPPFMLLKSDGGTTYQTRDLACIAFRKENWHPDLYLYEVGADQTLHFRQLFSVASKLGLGKPEQFVHIGHGLIRLPSGKMSTRQGKTVHLEEVLDEAVSRSEKIIDQGETGRGLTPEEKKEVSLAVGIGAIKYFDLGHHFSTDILFDWEKMFQLEGNSGPYLQYTYARCMSVLKKAAIGHEFFQKAPRAPEEIAILRTLYKFPEIVILAAQTYSPNLLCNFLFDLAQKYNLFYNKLSILKAENPKLRAQRLVLTAATSQIIKNGLNLLGIKALEKM